MFTHCSLPVMIEVLDGLKTYFDFTLSDHLLYGPEMPQYKIVVEKTCLLPSSVYGAEHLLRLFVRLPHFLCHAGISPSITQLLYCYFKELLA